MIGTSTPGQGTDELVQDEWVLVMEYTLQIFYL